MLNKIREVIEQQDIEQAMELIREFEENQGVTAEFYNLKAVVAIKIQEYSVAEECLRKGLELNPQNTDLYFNLAYVYECQKKYKEAIIQYQKLLSVLSSEEERKEVLEIIQEIQQKIEQDQEIIIKDTDNKTAPELCEQVYIMRENIQKSATRKDAPLVSVFVLAYNNLEKYTKTCVECILKYTKNVDYELILVDNGSSDGTFEYFKSIVHPKKKIIKITKNIGMFYGGFSGFDAWEGKYLVTIANDIYVTENWLYNMLVCAESDPKIGIVTPVSDNVSSRQKVEWKYDDFDDMQRKAAENNISDPRKWEERLRIITLGTMYKRTCWDMMGMFDYGFIHDFSDDDIAFRARRAGYKVMLCQDAFVSHAGKMKDKGAELAEQSLKKGRKMFKEKYYGIDAWDDCDNYEGVMMSLLERRELEANKGYKTLGIDVRCGMPILEVKNRLRREGIFNVELSAFTTEAKYWMDLHTICEGKVVVDRTEYIKDYFKQGQFDYIVIGRPINEYKEPEKVIYDTLTLLDKEGQLLLKVANDKDINMFLKVFGDSAYRDVPISKFNLNNLNQYIEEQGYCITEIEKEIHLDKMDIISKAAETIIGANNERQPQETVAQLIIKNYVVSIKKSK